MQREPKLMVLQCGERNKANKRDVNEKILYDMVIN